jgi:hypothetical protein
LCKSKRKSKPRHGKAQRSKGQDDQMGLSDSQQERSHSHGCLGRTPESMPSLCKKPKTRGMGKMRPMEKKGTRGTPASC